MLSGVVLYTTTLGVASCVEVRCVFVYSRVCQLTFGSLVYILYMAKSNQRRRFHVCISSDVTCMKYEVGARRRLVMLALFVKKMLDGIVILVVKDDVSCSVVSSTW